MSRLVRVPPARLARAAGPEGKAKTAAVPAVSPDGYLERIAKYVPAEVLGCFVFVNAILAQSAAACAGPACMAGLPVHTIAVALFVLAWVLTPVSIWYLRQEGDAWQLNAVMATLAFPVWVYALGAVAVAPWYDGHLAAILLATFTAVGGLVKPSAAEPKQAAVTQPVTVEALKPAVVPLEPARPGAFARMLTRGADEPALPMGARDMAPAEGAGPPEQTSVPDLDDPTVRERRLSDFLGRPLGERAEPVAAKA